MTMRARYLIFLFAAACTADSITMHEYGLELQDALPCHTGDTCVLFNPNVECLCPSVINSRSVDHMRDVAGKVDCAGATASCPANLQNPRCIDSVCSGDPPSTNPPSDAGAD
jgi:hypothetical protein